MDSYNFMSDTEGKLIYYTNGCDIYDASNAIMENGDDLNTGITHVWECDGAWGGPAWGGYVIQTGIISVPIPNIENQYVMFHMRKEQDYFDSGVDLLYSIVDMSGNNGLGTVTEKNVLLMDNTLLAWSISAVRHGNGRDWWIVCPVDNRNKFYTFLIDPQGIHGPFEQVTGSLSGPWLPGQEEDLTCTFTPDGSKFIRVCRGEPGLFGVYDFDRCSGRFSNLEVAYFPESYTHSPAAGVSRDSRYLYITNHQTKLYQYDLWANSITDSRFLVGEYDGFVMAESGLPTTFLMPTLAPNGKLYMSATSAVRVLHTIHEPQNAGLECDFRQHDLLLAKVNFFYMPNLPNFRLYNLPGSACDSLELETPIQSYWRASQDAGACPLQRTFRDLSWHAPASWLWDFGDGATATEASPTHVYEAPGTYNVCLTVCKDNGDCHTSCREVVVSDSLGNTYLCGKRLLVYPNPAWDRLWVYYENMPQGAQFYIYDELGRLVATQALDEGSLAQPIDISILPQGFYAWQIVLNNNMPYSVGKLTVHR